MLYISGSPHPAACVEPELRSKHPERYYACSALLYMYVVCFHVTEQPCGIFLSCESAKAGGARYTKTKADFCSLYKIAPGDPCVYTDPLMRNDAQGQNGE